MAKSNILTAIDIGTNSAKILVGQKTRDTQEVSILAKDEIPHSVGVRKGEIYDPKKIGEVLTRLKEGLQKSKGIKIKKAVVNIGGSHLFSIHSQGLVSVSRADQKISKEDIDRVLQAAQAVNLPSNKEIIDVIPQEFIVDGERGIKDPLGLQGIRLEAKVVLICAFSPVLENLEKSLFEAGLEIKYIIPSPLASSRAVLTSEQKELGVAVIDMGGGTTSLSVFGEGDLIDFAVFPVGSSNITNDIAIGLRTEIATAEEVKKEFGVVDFSTKKSKIKKGKIEIPEKELSFPRSFLRNIIRSRLSETFSEVAKRLKKISKETILPGGVILTGGGASLPKITEFAKQKFELPCYLSGPKGISGLEEPSFSCCAGLLLSGFDFDEENEGKEGEGIVTRLKNVFKIFLP